MSTVEGKDVVARYRFLIGEGVQNVAKMTNAVTAGAREQTTAMGRVEQSVHAVSGAVLKAAEVTNNAMARIHEGISRVNNRMIITGSAGVIASGGLIKMAMSMEQTRIAFTTMLGSADKATKLLGELKDFAATTPFEFTEIQVAAKSLLAFGIGAEQITDTLRRLGDISSGVGQPLNEIAQIYGKARVQGRLFAEDVNQFTGRGIPIIQELAKQFGVADNEIKALVEDGKVNFSHLEEAFRSLTAEGSMFGGMMAEQAKTAAGALSNLKDQVVELGTALGKGMLPTFKLATKFVSDLTAKFNALSEGQKSAIGQAILWGSLALIIGGAIGKVLMVVGPLILAWKIYRLISGYATMATGVQSGVLTTQNGILGLNTGSWRANTAALIQNLAARGRLAGSAVLGAVGNLPALGGGVGARNLGLLGRIGTGMGRIGAGGASIGGAASALGATGGFTGAAATVVGGSVFTLLAASLVALGVSVKKNIGDPAYVNARLLNELGKAHKEEAAALAKSRNSIGEWAKSVGTMMIPLVGPVLAIRNKLIRDAEDVQKLLALPDKDIVQANKQGMIERERYAKEQGMTEMQVRDLLKAGKLQVEGGKIIGQKAGTETPVTGPSSASQTGELLAAHEAEVAAVNKTRRAIDSRFAREWGQRSLLAAVIGGQYETQMKQQEELARAQTEHDRAVNDARDANRRESAKLILEESLKKPEEKDAAALAAQQSILKTQMTDAMDAAAAALEQKKLSVELEIKKSSFEQFKEKIQNAFELTILGPRFKEMYKASFTGMQGQMTGLAAMAGAPLASLTPAPLRALAPAGGPGGIGLPMPNLPAPGSAPGGRNEVSVRIIVENNPKALGIIKELAKEGAVEIFGDGMASVTR